MTNSIHNLSLLSSREYSKHSRLGQLALAESSLIEQRIINDSKLIEIYSRDLSILKEKEHLYFFTNFKEKLESEIFAKETELEFEAGLLKELMRRIKLSQTTKPMDLDKRLENLIKEEAYLSKKLKMILKTNFNLKKKLQEKLKGKSQGTKTSPFKTADKNWNSSRFRDKNQSIVDQNPDQSDQENLLDEIQMKAIGLETETNARQSKLIEHTEFEIGNLKYSLVAQKCSQDSYRDVQLHRIQLLENFLANDCLCKANLTKALKGSHEVDMCPKRCLFKLRYLMDQIGVGVTISSIRHEKKESRVCQSHASHLEDTIFNHVRRPINLSRLSGFKMPEMVNTPESGETFTKKSSLYKQTVEPLPETVAKTIIPKRESRLSKNETSSDEYRVEITKDIRNIADVLSKKFERFPSEKSNFPSFDTSEFKSEIFHEKLQMQVKDGYLEDPSQKDQTSNRVKHNKKVSINLSEARQNNNNSIAVPTTTQTKIDKETLVKGIEKTEEQKAKPSEPEPEGKFHTYNHQAMIRNVNKKKAKTTTIQQVHNLIRFKSYELLLKQNNIEQNEPPNSQIANGKPSQPNPTNLSDEFNPKSKTVIFKSKTGKPAVDSKKKRFYDTPKESTIEPVSNKSKFFSQNQFLSKFKTMNAKNKMPSGSDSFIENEYENKPVDEPMILQPKKSTLDDERLRGSGTIDHSNSFKSVKGRGQFNFNFEEDDSKTVVTNFFDMKSEQN